MWKNRREKLQKAIWGVFRAFHTVQTGHAMVLLWGALVSKMADVMEFTHMFSQIVGPVLLLRALSLVVDRGHFAAMLENLEKETDTVSFSLFPIALAMACIAVLRVHDDRSSLAAMLILVIAWGGLIKASFLIVFPRLIAEKAKLMAQIGFLNVVLVSCLLVGGYFTWFGYFQ